MSQSPTSDFPEFDQAYRTVLVKDLEDKFEQLAAEANFNIYHSDIWRGTARKFAELVVLECVRVAKSTDADDGDDYKSGRTWAGMDILKHFGVK